MDYLLITIILVVCAYLYIKIATKLSIVDNPNFRSSHTIPVIRGGGILFYLAVILFLIFFGFQYLYFVIAISSVAFISFIDDIYTLSAKIRLPIHFISIILILYEVGLLESPFYLIATVLVIGVGFINVYNFMDGINAITGIYSITILSTFLFLAHIEGVVNASLLISVLLSLLIFGFLNFRKKARLFAGDIGSISIAILIFFCCLKFIIALQSPIIVLVVVVYGIDGGITILYRLFIGESITQPHRHHIYQKLVDTCKWSHIKVSLVYGILQLGINIIVIISYKLNLTFQVVLMVLIVILLSLLYFMLFKKIKISKK